jgi:hypothetical protein
MGGGHGIFAWKRASRPGLSISPNRRSLRIEEASPERNVEPAHAAKKIAPANPVTDPTLVALRVIANLRRSSLHSANTLNIIFGQEVFCAPESGEVYIMRKVETLGQRGLDTSLYLRLE